MDVARLYCILLEYYSHTYLVKFSTSHSQQEIILAEYLFQNRKLTHVKLANHHKMHLYWNAYNHVDIVVDLWWYTHNISSPPGGEHGGSYK